MVADLSFFQSEKAKANTRRVRLYPWGQVLVGRDQRGNNLDFVVDREFFTDLKESYDDAKTIGALSPFAFAHQPDVDGPSLVKVAKALTPGWITELGADAEGIYSDVCFAGGVVELWDQGLLSSISPSHYTNFRNQFTGKTYKRALREVSAIGLRHLKNLPIQSGYYQFAEDGGWTAITELEESPMTTANTTQTTDAALTTEQITKIITDGIAEGLKPITQTVTSLSEQVDALKKPDTTVTNNGEETADQKRVRELEAQVAKLTRDAQIAQNKATVMGRLPGADAALVTSLSESLLSTPAQTEILIKGFEPLHGVEAVKARGQQTTTTVLGERGAQGGGAGQRVPLSRAKAEAAAAGKAPGKEQMDWAVAQYGAAQLDANA